MPPTPAPTPPIEVFVHSGGAEWWQIFAALSPLAVLIAGAAGAFMAWRTLRQKSVADNRSEWWKRTQWALDAVYSGDPKRGKVGLKVLQVLGESELAGDGELAVLEAAWEKPLENAEKRLKLVAAAPGPGDKVARYGSSPASSALAEVARAAALTLDEAAGQGDNGEEETSGDPEGGKR
ncbi:MAG TPA: hypothetical protein VF867_01625 [Arthrobacter sp.]